MKDVKIKAKLKPVTIGTMGPIIKLAKMETNETCCMLYIIMGIVKIVAANVVANRSGKKLLANNFLRASL